MSCMTDYLWVFGALLAIYVGTLLYNLPAYRRKKAEQRVKRIMAEKKAIDKEMAELDQMIKSFQRKLDSPEYETREERRKRLYGGKL